MYTFIAHGVYEVGLLWEDVEFLLDMFEGLEYSIIRED